MPAQRRNGDAEPPADTPLSGDLSHWDVFFLEALGYHDHLSSDDLIALGVSNGLTAMQAEAWINDAATRGAIEPIEPGAGADTQWRISR
jgi:hypothetical protein